MKKYIKIRPLNIKQLFNHSHQPGLSQDLGTLCLCCCNFFFQLTSREVPTLKPMQFVHSHPLVEIEADLFMAQIDKVHRFIVLFNVCSVFLEVWNCQTSGRTLCSPDLSVQLFFSSVRSCLTCGVCKCSGHIVSDMSVILVVTQCMALGPVATERCYSFLLATS